jgi:hypothetical protein
VTNSGSGAYEAALAAREDGFVAVWYDTRDGHGEIYMRLLDAGGRPAGPEQRLTNSPEESYEPSVSVVGPDRIAVAWYDKSADGTLVPKLGVWNIDGTHRWTRTVAPAGRNPAIARDADGVFCAWIAPGADGREWVWGGWWTNDGGPDGTVRAFAPAGPTTWSLNVIAGDPGHAWVVFDATAGTRADELFLVHVEPDASTVVRLTADDGIPSKYPDIAGTGLMALAWYDERDGNTEVYVMTAPVNELTGEIDGRARRITSTPGASIGAYLAWNGNRIGLAWSDDSEGQHEIYFQALDEAAQPLAPPRRVTANRTASLIPAVEPWQDGFALAWNEYVPVAEGHVGTSEIAFAIVR